MRIEYPEIGICGLSCRLCPAYFIEGDGRCGGCKCDARMHCSFITCAIKKKGIEFCWVCDDSTTCEKWRKRRNTGKHHDSFKCYTTLEKDIAFIRKYGIKEFEKLQKEREKILRKMLKGYDEGDSLGYYCIAATVLEIDELEKALSEVRKQSKGLDMRGKSKILHSILDDIATKKIYCLKLRK
jgi:hypothetical protein